MAKVTTGLQFQFGMGEFGCGIPRDDVACNQKQTFDPGEPEVQVTLKPFELDVHEVTVEQYNYCVEMGVCSRPAGDNGLGYEDYYRNTKFTKHPAVLVTWMQASEYCGFVGKRLPTEFEWERVAGGPAADALTKRLFTFLPEPGPEAVIPAKCERMANGHMQSIDVNLAVCTPGTYLAREAMASKDDAVCVGGTEAVGIDGHPTCAGGTQVFDLAGNVAEWTSSDAGDNNPKFPYKVTCDATQTYECEKCTQCLVQFGPANKDCKLLCPACKCGPGNDKAGCYTPCDNPVCPTFPADYTYDGSYVAKNYSVRRVVRGGSAEASSAGDVCKGRSDDRRFTLEAGAAPLTFVGFRCARTL
jgi:formylglycine-generating enzyme required for sulfatase activity